jgi:hypothetical protein
MFLKGYKFPSDPLCLLAGKKISLTGYNSFWRRKEVDGSDVVMVVRWVGI